MISSVVTLLQRIRDLAHRFDFSGHSVLLAVVELTLDIALRERTVFGVSIAGLHSVPAYSFFAQSLCTFSE